MPFVEISLAYNLYIFSIFFDGLNLINGILMSACIDLNIISNGILYVIRGFITNSILDIPFSM